MTSATVTFCGSGTEGLLCSNVVTFTSSINKVVTTLPQLCDNVVITLEMVMDYMYMQVKLTVHVLLVVLISVHFTIVIHVVTGDVGDTALPTTEGSGNVQSPTEGSVTTISGNVL